LKREKAAAAAAKEAVVRESEEKKANKEKKKRAAETAAEEDIDDATSTSKKSRKDKKKPSSLSEPMEDVSMIDAEEAIPADLKKSKKEKKKKATSSTTAPTSEPTVDILMLDQENTTPPESIATPAPAKSDVEAEVEDVFGNIYLKRVVAELTDDLDKVREANDFSNRSMPMLIHALRQGSSVYSAEERRRVVSAAATA
jgi:ribosome assembly protein 3